MELRREILFPSAVFGPTDFFAFARVKQFETPSIGVY
jgi:hypothetical protein